MDITPDDGFGLALIAKNPKENADLVETLSKHVQIVGRELIGIDTNNKEAKEAAATLRKWAHSNVSI